MENGKQLVEKKDKSPAALIELAVAGNADLEKLEKVLELQVKWEANEAKKAYHRAMAKFKENPPEIDKDKKVSFGNTSYNHASLANVVLKITSALSEHGLSAHWTTEQNGSIKVTCHITHVLGHSEKTALSAPSDTSGSKNPIQAIGSTISYLERYTLLAALGLAASDMDNDAQVEIEYVSKEQLGILLDIVDNLPDSENKKGKFLNFMEVDSFAKIRALDYEKARSSLVAAQHKAGEK